MATVTLRTVVIMLAWVHYHEVQCQSFFPANQNDMFRSPSRSSSLFSGSGTTPAGYGAYTPRTNGHPSLSPSSPFSQIFGSGLASPSTLGLLDSSRNNGFGTGSMGRIDSFSAPSGVSREESFPSMTRSHPFSSIRLNPVPTSKGVSMTRPHEDPGFRDMSGLGEMARERDRFNSLFDSENARKYSLDSPSTFEKPINKMSLPDVNSPIQLDLAADEQQRVAYAKKQGQLAPSRGVKSNADEDRPRVQPVLSRTSLLSPPPHGRAQGLVDWDQPSALPAMPGHASPITQFAPDVEVGGLTRTDDATDPRSLDYERQEPKYDETAPFLHPATHSPTPHSSSTDPTPAPLSSSNPKGVESTIRGYLSDESAEDDVLKSYLADQNESDHEFAADEKVEAKLPNKAGTSQTTLPAPIPASSSKSTPKPLLTTGNRDAGEDDSSLANDTSLTAESSERLLSQSSKSYPVIKVASTTTRPSLTILTGKERSVSENVDGGLKQGDEVVDQVDQALDALKVLSVSARHQDITGFLDTDNADLVRSDKNPPMPLADSMLDRLQAVATTPGATGMGSDGHLQGPGLNGPAAELELLRVLEDASQSSGVDFGMHDEQQPPSQSLLLTSQTNNSAGNNDAVDENLTRAVNHSLSRSEGRMNYHEQGSIGENASSPLDHQALPFKSGSITGDYSMPSEQGEKKGAGVSTTTRATTNHNDNNNHPKPPVSFGEPDGSRHQLFSPPNESTGPEAFADGLTHDNTYPAVKDDDLADKTAPVLGNVPTGKSGLGSVPARGRNGQHQAIAPASFFQSSPRGRPGSPGSSGSPFELMFGKSLQDAYDETFGSLFANINRAPTESGSLLVDTSSKVPSSGYYNSQPSASYADQGFDNNNNNNNNNNVGFGDGLKGAEFVGDGGGGVFGGGGGRNQELFEENVNGIVNKRPSLRLFGGEK